MIKLGLFLCMCIVGLKAESISFKDKYFAEWTISGDEITFTITANTTGWVGIGFGPNTNMRKADLAVGGVRGGKGYLYDLHGKDGYEDDVESDQQEDYKLLDAKESNGQTTVKIKRKLDTGDSNDVSLKGPVYVLWAFNSEEDVVSESKFPYHGGDRGHEKQKRTFS